MKMIVLRAASPRPRVVLRGTVPVSAADPGDLRVEVVDLSPREIAELRRDPGVLEASPPMPTRLIQPRKTPSPSSSTPEVSWGVRAVGADSCPYNGAGVTVAVLDTGIDAAYASLPTFAGVEIVTRNFTEDVDEDTDGHGTHCAGTIFGRQTDGCRVGVAPGVRKALIGKVLGPDGGSTESIYEGILWASGNGAQVISMSLGMDFPGYRELLANERQLPPELATSMALTGYLSNVRLFDRLSQATSGRDGAVAGTVVVAAAGNESRRDENPAYRITVSPPAAAELFLSVAAIGQAAEGADHPYAVADFSNVGARLAAPGVDIWSARLGGGLTSMSGTSMAGPHVAGVAALWAERFLKRGNRFRASRVLDELQRAVIPLDYLDADDVGLGLVQAPK